LKRICSSCRKVIIDDAFLFCPYCSARLDPLPPALAPTRFPMAVGVLAVIASCFSLVVGLFAVLSLINNSLVYGFNQPLLRQSVLLTIFGFLGFVLGLNGGMNSMKRRRFAMSMGCLCFLLACGVITVVDFWPIAYGGFLGSLALGLPIIVLSNSAIIFVSVSRGEFGYSR